MGCRHLENFGRNRSRRQNGVEQRRPAGMAPGPMDVEAYELYRPAGKRTFSTEEIIHRIRSARLQDLVSHRTVIVPQLGAPGVAAHDVRKETGFRVIYGPVMAADIPAFLTNGFKCSPEMRRVAFPLKDRMALIPIELVGTLRYLWIPLLLFLLLDLFSPGFFRNLFLKDVLLTMGAVIAGTVLTQVFLPWLPGRAFALKGWVAGLIVTGGLGLCFSLPVVLQISDLLLFPAAAAYMGLNFTGATPFTSLSGVVKEMSTAIPVILLSLLAALVLRIVFLFG
ncbi:MAG: acetyl-CoA synthase subunit gamma [Acidobacteriota bacterium]